MSNGKAVVEISTEGLKKILEAYNTIGNFLEHYVAPEVLYKEEFARGMEVAFKEVHNKKTKKVRCLKDLSI